MAGEIDFQNILDNVLDEHARQGLHAVLNLLEDVLAENRALRDECQRLRDEINRLKGEQGKPPFKPGKPRIFADAPAEHSSEDERKKRHEWHKGTKFDRIAIDREQHLCVDPALLPPDAVFKGREEVVVQNLIIRTENVRFLKR